MSSHKDNTNNKNLKDLLNKSGERKEPLDPFEQEALEGFAMLENSEEALKLKNKLDAKLYSEVFTSKKKSTGKYWYAAAGLLLVIGFTIYFFRSSTLAKEEKLAIQTETLNKGDEIQKSIEAQTKKNQSLEIKPETPENASPAGLNESETHHWTNDQPVAKPFKAVPSKASNTYNEPIAYDAAPLVSSQAAPPEEIQDNKNLQVPGITNPKKDDEGLNDLTKSKDEEKELVVVHSAFKLTDSTLSVASESNRDKESKKKAMRERASDKQEVFAAPAASSGATQMKPLTVVDETALQKELKETLKTKNLAGKFDAILKINKTGKLDAVIFTKTFNFTTEQQKEIIEILKHLKSLTFSNLNEASALEYYLSFRP